MAVIEALETRLAAHPCVMNLDRWERLYAYDVDLDTAIVNESVILFHYRQAGRYFRAGRVITYPLSWLEVDDREYDLIDGQYDRVSNRIEVEGCAPSIRNDVSEASG